MEQFDEVIFTDEELAELERIADEEFAEDGE